LTIFAKGNLDVRDSLHSLKLGGTVLWNGINTVIRERHPGVVVRLKHETLARTDALLAAAGTVPDLLSSCTLPMGPHSLASQFSDAIFASDHDVVVLSLQADLSVQLLRHRREGFLLMANEYESWPSEGRRWARAEFEVSDFLDAETSMANLAGIIARIRERSQSPILIYNVSSVVPGDEVHCHQGLDDLFATRVRRFNLALVDLSQRTGISVIDVDRIVARGGADRLKIDTLHFTAEGCRLVAEEVVRVLADLGCLAPVEAA
jgi:hypothetical protein